ncbi:MAG: hypothetical protein ACK5LZ_03265 [Anaerorhabdus sp.]
MRYTKKVGAGYELMEESLKNEAIQVLGAIEDMLEVLEIEQEEHSKNIEKYHDGGRKIHYRAREAYGQKVVNSAIISKLKQLGLGE